MPMDVCAHMVGALIECKKCTFEKTHPLKIAAFFYQTIPFLISPAAVVFYSTAIESLEKRVINELH
jgi:hypothetical protein